MGAGARLSGSSGRQHGGSRATYISSVHRIRGIVVVVFAAVFAAVLVALPRHQAAVPVVAHGLGGRVTTASLPPTTAATRGGVGATSTTTASGAALVAFPAPQKGLRPGPSLAPGSDPSVLPADVLIADRSNNRVLIVDPAGKLIWQFPRPGDLAPGQTFLIPDDAFFTPDGQYIITTEEDDQVVSLISIAQHRIVWRYGTAGTSGSTANHLSNPDDAMMLPDGNVVVADIKNCSILVLRPGLHVPIMRIGENTNACLHAPPARFGSPNGAFPLADGNYLVTEINGDWVDEMSLTGKVLWSTNPPGVAYPSDTNQVGPNRFLTVDYSNPGQVIEFDSSGHLLWHYGPTSGPGMLNQPSLCKAIPTNGDVLCNDDLNHRVIVIDPRTDRIVWQYGHDGVAGSSAGYLFHPDGVDLAPPDALAVLHKATMGVPTGACAPAAPAGSCTFYDSAGNPSSTPTALTSSVLGSSAATQSAQRASGARVANAASPRIATLPLALSREVVVADGGHVAAVLGGLDLSNVSVSGVTLLDISNGHASAAGNLAGSLHDAAGAVLKGRAFIFGGGTSASVSTVEAVTLPALGKGGSPRTGAVARAVVTGNLPAARSDASAVTSGGVAYIVGGYDGVSADPGVLATSDGSHFRTVASLAVPVRYPAVAAAGGLIYVFGGQAVGGANPGQVLDTVQVVDPRRGTAKVVGHLPGPLAGASAATVRGTIYLAGGDPIVQANGGGSGTVRSIWSYSPTSGRVRLVGRLAVPVSHAGVVSLSSGAWLVGGEDNGTAVTAVQRLPVAP